MKAISFWIHCGTLVFLLTGTSAGKDFPTGLEAFLTPAATVTERMQQGRPVQLIDVRARQAFDTVRIPGALHLPLFAVQSRAALKPYLLVLVGEGYACRRLLEACWRLAEQGFQARVLHGGIRGWYAAGGPLEGDRSALVDPPVISAMSFLREKGLAHWVVLSFVDDPAIRTLVPAGRYIQMHAGEKRLSVAERLRQIAQNDPVSAFLVIAEDSANPGQLCAGLTAPGPGHMVRLDGGPGALKKALQFAALSARPGPERIRVVSGCPACQPGSAGKNP